MPERTSVRRTILLLVERFGVDGVGRGDNARENRQGNQGGYDGLHGSMLQTMQAAQLLPVIDEQSDRTML
jgi:hypothetical protein